MKLGKLLAAGGRVQYAPGVAPDVEKGKILASDIRGQVFILDTEEGNSHGTLHRPDIPHQKIGGVVRIGQVVMVMDYEHGLDNDGEPNGIHMLALYKSHTVDNKFGRPKLIMNPEIQEPVAMCAYQEHVLILTKGYDTDLCIYVLNLKGQIERVICREELGIEEDGLGAAIGTWGNKIWITLNHHLGDSSLLLIAPIW